MVITRSVEGLELRGWVNGSNWYHSRMVLTVLLKKYLWLYVPRLTTTMHIQLKCKIKYITHRIVVISLALSLPNSFWNPAFWFSVQFFKKCAVSVVVITTERSAREQAPIWLGCLLGISRGGATGLSLICIDYIPNSNLPYILYASFELLCHSRTSSCQLCLCVEFISKLTLPVVLQCLWRETNGKRKEHKKQHNFVSLTFYLKNN